MELQTFEGKMEDVPEGMGAFAIMGIVGDTKQIWDPRKPAEVEAARLVFDKLRKDGYLAFRVDGKGEKGEQVTKFDSNEGKYIFAPPMTGG